MPFKDTNEGQTHSFGDNCGMKEHNMKTISEIEKEFDKLFIHKGEDGDDMPDDWVWTIRGSFPSEVKLFLSKAINQAREEERERILEIIEKQKKKYKAIFETYSGHSFENKEKREWENKITALSDLSTNIKE